MIKENTNHLRLNLTTTHSRTDINVLSGYVTGKRAKAQAAEAKNGGPMARLSMVQSGPIQQQKH